MTSNNEYNFDYTNIFDLLLHKNIYEILSHNNKINKLLTNEKVIPDLNLISTTFDDYVKFIDAHLPETNSWATNFQSHLLLIAITNNLHIDISTDFYYNIKEAIGINPTFLQLIFLNNIPRYEVKIYFDGIQAEKDLYNLLFKTYKCYFSLTSEKNKQNICFKEIF